MKLCWRRGKLKKRWWLCQTETLKSDHKKPQRAQMNSELGALNLVFDYKLQIFVLWHENHQHIEQCLPSLTNRPPSFDRLAFRLCSFPSLSTFHLSDWLSSAKPSSFSPSSHAPFIIIIIIIFCNNFNFELIQIPFAPIFGAQQGEEDLVQRFKHTGLYWTVCAQ